MINKLLKNFFGTRNVRILRGLEKYVRKINALEPDWQALSDEALQAKTAEFKQRLGAGKSLDDILPEVFATVREAALRVLQMRHFDVQLIGGMILHQGKIAEMRTGEGKTLVGTLPAYLNALSGKGVHIVTVNDYLAQRDSEWMRPLYEFLGLSVGVNLTNMDHEQKQAAYAADITYGTNNEFGFDYLRDNMVFSLAERVQRPLNYAIVDEVDSILIDEARTPLIISGAAEQSSDLYGKIDKLIPKLTKQAEKDGPGDYSLDEKNRQAFLTETGHQKVEDLLIKEGLLAENSSLYDASNISIMHYVSAALRAHTLFQCDVDYIVKDDQVIIVDEHTGRLMEGRRWSEGLHQAMEAKEGVSVQLENQTLATITFQNYFRLYEKLSGMTGTADTEAFELQKIYGLEVVVIPTNKPLARKELPDQVYLTEKEKFAAIVVSIKKSHEQGQPVLVGTASIENSERLSVELKKANIPHEVLNAKQHQREAGIITQAGRPGKVTLATNMAGRGTDIVLGGSLDAELAELGENPSAEQIQQVKKDWQERHNQVLEAGGLHVLGSERHESRRIDNQLRGRSGRQGDAGSSQFYLSLEDNLLRIFAAERLSNMMRKLGIKEGEVIEHTWINRAIENAQRKVEGLNFDIRKQLLEFDDVANDQRKVVYQQRFELMSSEDVSAVIDKIRAEAIEILIDNYIPPQSMAEQWNIEGLEQQIQQDFNLKMDINGWLEKDETLHEETLREKILEEITADYKLREQRLGEETMRELEKSVLLQLLDHNWKEHLAAMDHLRQGIHLRGYAQKNPAQEFKRESFEMFKEMMGSLKYEIVSTLARVEVPSEQDLAAMQAQQQQPQNLQYHHADASAMTEQEAPPAGDEAAGESQQPFVRGGPKVGRNDPCPCGSGKKYKQCHGKLV